MAPPSASISRTRCPLPMPPMAGLQLIWPTVSMLWVRSRVRAPMRAQASAASVPACPPPTTMTSCVDANRLALLIFLTAVAYARRPRGTGIVCNRCRKSRMPVTPRAPGAAATRGCLGDLGARAEVSWYTTSVAVQDLERVRAALGYERINLYGTSYGTRVAQHYLRRFPERVRAVILDGVVPAPLALGPEVALDAERSLLDILARCAAQPPCRSRFGDPAQAYRSVRAALARRAVPVSVSDPSTGEPRRFDFTAEHLATVLRLASYSAEYAALLPLLLGEAASRADYAPLAAQFLLIERAYAGAVATGMHDSVVCTEDVPFYRVSARERTRLADTFLGTAQLDGLETVCRIWPHGAIDPDFHAPLTSGVPALLLSGGDDPVTPPAFAALAARGFAHGLSVVLEGFGHGALTAPCLDRVMAQFLARASVAGLDVACTRAARPMPFFTSVNGPAP